MKPYLSSITRLLSLLMMVMCFEARAQERVNLPDLFTVSFNDIKPLHIGDTIPKHLWHLPLQVVNHPEGKDTITLNDYRGKLIILDLWATWCGSCINEMPRLDSISKMLNENLVLLAATEEAAARVTKFVQNNSLLKKISPLSITNGQILSSYFPHRSVPHVIIIDEKGIVRSETLPGRLDYENLFTFVSTGRKAWHEKFNHANRIFPVKSDFVTPHHFYSVFSGAADGLGRKHGLVTDTVENIKRFYGSNVPLRLLLTRAVGQFVIPKSRIRLHPSIDRSLFYDSLFTYEATFPVQYADSAIEACLLNDMRRYTGLNSTLERQWVDCWVIYQPNSAKRSTDRTATDTVRLNSVVSAINAIEGATPVITEGRIKHLPVKPYVGMPLDFESFGAYLENQGLGLRKERELLDILVVSK